MNRFILGVVLAFLSTLASWGQPVFRIDSLPSQGLLLNKGWKFHAGDNPEWAKPEFDDSGWEEIDPSRTIEELPQIRQQPIGWFRLKLHVDSSLLHKPLAAYVYQSIASELYLTGKLIKQYGRVSQHQDKIKAMQPLNNPVGLHFDKTEQVVAIRFSIQPDGAYFKYDKSITTFKIGINDVWGASQYNGTDTDLPVLHGLYIGAFLMLSIIHFGFFLFYKKQKANLFFSIATFSAALANICYTIWTENHDVIFRDQLGITITLLYSVIFNLFLLVAVYYLFDHARKIYFYFLITYFFISAFVRIYEMNALGNWMLFSAIFLGMIEILRVSYIAYRNKFRDAGIILGGVSCYLFFWMICELINRGVIANRPIGLGNRYQLLDLIYHIYVNALPLALPIYFFRNFAATSRNLEEKLAEVHRLSADKQQLLAAQNETLEKQVAERTNQLRQSLTDLRTTQTQLIQREKMASLGELTAGIAHEIQNPLNFVNNFAEVSVELADELEQSVDAGQLALTKELATDLRQNMHLITQNGQRASNIVRGMLEHSRTATGERLPTDLNALCEEYLRLAYQGIRAKDAILNCKLETHFDPNLPLVSVVASDISRVLLNLYHNAFYAVGQKQKTSPAAYQPTVWVSTTQAKGSVEIRVRDNGMGIPEAIQSKIFQPFFTTKPTGEGTGLGLSLSYDIVTKGHGGEIQLISELSNFTEFTIYLPNPTYAYENPGRG